MSTPPPPPASATLTVNNAKTFAGAAYNFLDMAQSALGEGNGLYLPGAPRPSRLPPHGNLPIAWSAKIDETQPCLDAGQIRIRGDVSEIDGTGTVTTTYEECEENGSIRRGATESEIDETIGGALVRYRMRFLDFTVVSIGGTGQIVFNGEIGVVTSQSSTARTTMNLTVTGPGSAQAYAARNLVTDYDYDSGSGFHVIARIQGEVAVNGLSAVHVLLTGSAVLLQGQQSAELLESEASVPAFRLYLDADGDGRYEWLARGEAERLLAPPPLINSSPVLGVALPLSGDTGVDNHFDLSGAVDPDADFLRFSFEIIDGPTDDFSVDFERAGNFAFRTATHGTYPVKLTVTDARGLAHALDTSMQILYPTPVLSANAPDVLHAGERLDFTVAAISSGTVRFYVKAGPPGLSVSQQGAVTWDPSAIGLFGDHPIRLSIAATNSDRETSFEHSLTVDEYRSNKLLMRGGVPPLEPGGTPQVIDFDGDGGEDALLIAEHRFPFVLQWHDGELREVWADGYSFGTAIGAIAYYDINNDGKPEMFVTSGGEFAVYDGATRAWLDGYMTAADYIPFLQVGELDATPGPDVVALVPAELGDSATIYVFDARTFEMKRQLLSEIYLNRVAVADLDSNPGSDIVLSTGEVRDLTWLNLKWSAPEGLNDVVAADVDLDGDVDVISTGQNRIVVWNGATGAVVLELPMPGHADVVAVTHVDADAQPEVIVRSAADNTLRAYDLVRDVLHPEYEIADVIIDTLRQAVAGDFDGDGTRDLLVATAGPVPSPSGQPRYRLFDLPHQRVVWSSAAASELTGPFMGGAARGVASNLVNFTALGTLAGEGRLAALSAVSGVVSGPRAVGGAGNAVAVTQADIEPDAGPETAVSVVEGSSTRIELYDAQNTLLRALAIPGIELRERVVVIDTPAGKRLLTSDSAGLLLIDPTSGELLATYVIPSGPAHALAQSPRTGRIFALLDNEIVAMTIVGNSFNLVKRGPTTNTTTLNCLLAFVDVGQDGSSELVAYGETVLGAFTLTVFDEDLNELRSSVQSIQIHALAPVSGSIVAALRSEWLGSKEFGRVFMQLLDVDSATQIWRSPVLPGRGAPGSIVFGPAPGGRYRIGLGTTAGMFVTP